MKLLLFFIFLINFYMDEPRELATLEVRISNVRNSEGHLLATLFNSEDGYPQNSDQAFRSGKIKAGTENNSFIFKDIPQGTYAIAILHDENNNGELDTNLMGIPKEGYGSSNNVEKVFRAPNFEESSISVTKKDVVIDIQLNY